MKDPKMCQGAKLHNVVKSKEGACQLQLLA